MEEQPVLGREPSREEFENVAYFVRTSTFENKKVSFCLQAFNGPCPFLAMANVLLLRAKLHIKPGVDRLKSSHILTLIGDSMLNNLATSQEEHVDEILSHLRDLQYGLQVNCGFSDCRAFERNGGFRVFDLLNIKVVHGWIPDDVETQSVLDSMTYNEASELVALADEIQMESDKNHDNNLSADQLEMMRKSGIIRRFFESSPSQITYEGLFRIHAALEEGELGVLFRNNHFTTIYLRQGVLYSLVTDIGYMHNDGAVWETLESLDGDTEMVDCNFARNRAVDNVATSGFDFLPAASETYRDEDAIMAARIQAESDAQLARSLQQQENAGRQEPVGKLKSLGLDSQGREILEDEMGQKFLRRADAAKKPRKPSPRRHHASALDDDDESSEESKCAIM